MLSTLIAEGEEKRDAKKGDESVSGRGGEAGSGGRDESRLGSKKKRVRDMR